MPGSREEIPSIQSGLVWSDGGSKVATIYRSERVKNGREKYSSGVLAAKSVPKKIAGSIGGRIAASSYRSAWPRVTEARLRSWPLGR